MLQQRRRFQVDRVELIERVNLHELNARLPKYVFARNAEQFLGYATCTSVTVMPWVFDQRAIRSEQSEINAPCVDRDAVELVGLSRSDAQAFADFMKEAQACPSTVPSAAKLEYSKNGEVPPGPA